MFEKLEKVIGAGYSGGDILLKSDLLYFSIGKHVSMYDHRNAQTSIVQVASSEKLSNLALSSCGKYLLSADLSGVVGLRNLQKNSTILRLGVKDQVLSVKFSNSSKFFAIVRIGQVDIWATNGDLSFEKVSLLRSFPIPFSSSKRNPSLSWSSDDASLILGCEDYNCRIFFIQDQNEELKSELLTGQKFPILGTCISDDNLSVHCISRNSTFITWLKFRGMWKIHEVRKLNTSSPVVSSRFNEDKSLLVSGFESGFFLLYDITRHVQLHRIALFNHSIDYCNFSDTGDVLVFGSENSGQISMWDWRNELIIYSLQGHQISITCSAFAKDGSMLVTGSGDFKVKVWNYISGACIVTFSEHSMPVSAVTFTSGNHVVVSASFDGTVRAFDLIRHRNFRILVGDATGQYNCLAVDSTGEIVCAGTCDTRKIFLWSIKSGRLLDIFVGHEAPISDLCFNLSDSLLISGSWDKTLRLWDIYDRKKQTEVISMLSDITCLNFNSYSSHLAVATIDGSISIFCSRAYDIVFSIESFRDLEANHSTYQKDDRITALSYSMNGDLLVASSHSHIYTFDTTSYSVLGRHSLQEWIPNEKSGQFRSTPLKNLHAYTRSSKSMLTANSPSIFSVVCSPVHQSMAISTKCGVYVFLAEKNSDKRLFDQGTRVYSSRVVEMIGMGSYTEAVSTALSLKLDNRLVHSILCTIPNNNMGDVIRLLPKDYILLLLEVLCSCLAQTGHLTMTLNWLNGICLLRREILSFIPQLNLGRILSQLLELHQTESLNTCQNKYMLDYICR